jgi:hypothetical protein
LHGENGVAIEKGNQLVIDKVFVECQLHVLLEIVFIVELWLDNLKVFLEL